MKLLLIIGAVLLFLLLLLITPIRIRCRINEGRAEARLSYGIFYFRSLYPRRKKAKKKTKIKAEEKTGAEDAKPSKKDRKSGLRELRSLIASIVIRMPSTFRLRITRLHVCVASGDPAKTALLYGTLASSLSFMLEWLDRHLVAIRPIRRGALSFVADFESDAIKADADLTLSATPFRLLKIGVGVLLPHLFKRRATNKKQSRTQQIEGEHHVRSEKQAERAD